MCVFFFFSSCFLVGAISGISSKSSADGLSFGLVFKQCDIATPSYGEKCLGILGYTPFFILLISSAIDLAKKGGLSVVSSKITHPSDQISHFSL